MKLCCLDKDKAIKRSDTCLRVPFLANRGGFTLMEVMIASAILAIAIAGVLTLISSGHRQLDNIRSNARANQILQQKLEDLRNLPNFASIVAASGTFSDPKDALGRFSGTITGTTTFRVMSETGTYITTGFGPNYGVFNSQTVCYLVTVTVGWRGLDGIRRTRSMTSVYLKNGLNDYVFPP